MLQAGATQFLLKGIEIYLLSITCDAALQAYRLDLNAGELHYDDMYGHT
jgi:hypothetical protein